MSRKNTPPPFVLSDALLDARPADTLDLHGLRADEVQRALEPFLKRQRAGTVVHVITGRGRGSPGRPALFPRVRVLLTGALKDFVADMTKDLDSGGFLVRRR